MRTKHYMLFLAFCLAALQMQAQSIYTLAGDGIPAFIGDGGPATAARLYHPKAAAIDAAGNVYIADADNNRIRMINTSGIMSTIAGNASPGYGGDGLPAASATLNRPNDIKFDAAGNTYICDADNHCIRKITAATGIISTVAGTPTTSGFAGDGGPATAALMEFPCAIALDAAGNLYIADQYNNRIRKVNTSGTISTVVGSGATGYAGAGGPATAADIGFPFGLAVDASGNIFISLLYANVVAKVNTAGTLTTYAGTGAAAFSGDGGPATAAEMDGQWGIATDAPGNLYIADYNNQRIRKVNTAGVISTVAGTGSSGYSGDGGLATSAWLHDPVGVAVNAGGAIYIADYNSHRLRRVDAIFTNVPSFIGGHTQTTSLCHDAAATSVNSLLAVNDADAGQVEYWSTVTGPVHGTLAATYTTLSTGSAVTPTGLTYTPTAGYAGTDSFTVRITDGTASDTTKVIVTINPVPTAGIITGIDSVCATFTVTLAGTVAGGVWSSASTSIATVTSGGIVTGVAAGTTTISYAVSSSCGTSWATLPFKVRPVSACEGAVNTITAAGGLWIFPNPCNGTFSVNLVSAVNEEVDMFITNLLGQKIKELTTTTNKQQIIDLNAPVGIYFLSVRTASEYWSEKVTVR